MAADLFFGRPDPGDAHVDGGGWHLYRVGERWQMGRSNMRVVIRVEGWEAVAFNVQVAEFPLRLGRWRDRAKCRSWGRMCLGVNLRWSLGWLGCGRMRRRILRLGVGVMLLNQRVLAGIGNVYKSEVAFAAGVNPFRAMGTLTVAEMERMVEFAQRYMKANVVDGMDGGMVTAGLVSYVGNRRTTRAMDREEQLWVYRRRGRSAAGVGRR